MRKCLATALTALPLLLVGPDLHAAYRIAPGDVVEMTVAGIPDIDHKATVDLDGNVSLPLIEPVKIGGLEVTSAQDMVKQKLAQKLYQQRIDGHDSVVAIAPDTVSLTIAEYRPVYLTGDVTKPGKQAYRPGMTVRQAVALAGGYEIMRFRMKNPFLESADLRDEYQANWMEFVKTQSEIWRIRSELGTLDQQASLEKMTDAPILKPELDKVRETAREQLALATKHMLAEKSYLQSLVDVSDQQLSLLKQRQGKEDENVEVDKAEYLKLKDFSDHGNLPLTRLAEVRRLYLFSSTQALQTSVQVTTTIRDRDDYQRRIARLDEDHRAVLLKQLEAATVELNALRSKLQAVGEKITYTGMIRSQLSRSGGASPSIHIIHAPADGGENVIATEDSEVRPGDTVDVALHAEIPRMPSTN